MTPSRRIHWLLMLLAWGAFVASLFLPAVMIDMGAWNNPNAQAAPGLSCAMVYWPFWASNILMLLSPLLTLVLGMLAKRFNPRWVYIGLSLFMVGSSAFAVKLSFGELFLSVHIGYALWCNSFMMMAWAYSVVPQQAQP